MKYEELLKKPPFHVPQNEKEKIYCQMMSNLTKHHREQCSSYEKFLNAFGCEEEFSSIEEVPFLPIGVFKQFQLKSISEDQIFKIITSSGTTGQKVSKICLDETTAQNQQKTLARIMGTLFGEKRVPMLILDSSKVLKDRRMFSARGAGILGFSIVSSKRLFAFDENMQIQLKKIRQFIADHREEPILVFGYTYMIWEYFYKILQKEEEKLSLENGILIHGGGWKKMQNQAVSKTEFKKGIKEVSGMEHIYDYYGMAEQTGCIYLECEYGHLHASTYSDVIIRRMSDFSVCDIGEEGILQVLSPAAYSYPGHSILTQDRGMLLGVDDCPCGRKGKYFKIAGRMHHAEIRGCSDTYESR